MSRTFLQIGLACIIAASTVHAQSTETERPFGTLREQAQLQQLWLQERLETVLPQLMREQNADMWVVAMREYNEDPVFRVLVSATTLAARRRTIYLFHDRGPDRGVDRIALGGTSQGGLYDVVRGTQVTEDGRQGELSGRGQWDLLADMVRERDPRRIAVNISEDHNFADGLTAGEWMQMEAALGPDLASRVVHAELLPINMLYVRVPGMRPTYRRMQELAWEIISTAFSNDVIIPGVTTTEDVAWWMRQRLNDLGMQTWFQPSVDVQRSGGVDTEGPTIIERGDVLHCDFGTTVLGLNTDTQHMGYVLREDEDDVPAGLKEALHNGNRLQDILLVEMRPGMTGNQVLQQALAKMRAAGIDGTIYTHPIGEHGHGAGPLIGRWDNQAGVPARGDVPLRGSTWYAIELQATSSVSEWDGQRVRIAMEEDAELTAEGGMRWILERQTEFHLVR